MTTWDRDAPRAVDVTIVDGMLRADLADGRAILVPVEWYPRLAQADSAQRGNWRLLGDGQGIHWPDVDEDISIEGMLLGLAAPGVTKKAN